MATYNIQNTPQINDLNDARSLLAAGNDVAKVARFAVTIDSVGGIITTRELTFLCEAAEFPGRALTTDDIRYYGPSFKMPSKSEYTDINLTFICRQQMREKEFFDAWMEFINPKDRYDFEYRDNYTTPIHIWQFSDIGPPLKATYKVTLRKAFPINVNPMGMNWAEDNFHRLQVTFAYTDWVTGAGYERNAPSFELAPNTTRTGGSILGSSSIL